MTEPENPRKSDPAEIRLRLSPTPVTRISRRALIVLAGVVGVIVCGALIYALDPPRLFRRGAGPELYNTDARPGADGLAALPRDYASIPRPAPPSVPQLGPPLPGDLGRPLLRAQQGGAPGPGAPPASNPEATRRQQEAEQALRSRVFFQTALQSVAARAPTGDVASPTGEQQRGDTGDPEFQQNMQGSKLAFLNAPVDRQIYAQHRLQTPASPYQLMAGTIIAGALVTAINSDLPGSVRAQVTENVYDTVSGRYLLIPQGSQLIGQYDSQVAFGQRRVLLVWTRLIRPDGSSIVLDRLPATDAAGRSGLEDDVDYHWERIFAAAALSTVLGVGAEVGVSDDDRLVAALRRGGQDTFNQTGQQIVRRNLNVQPTLTLRPGLSLSVIINRDIVLAPYRG